ncbi:helix-turn-helix transcriptional regulator [uncultured Hoeflea sp.]|uniref:helix-turn-helix transcriptional regulator n=1 Tax=uncultured Hoeflea sp. TaxID=538666 RepID=UPI0026137A07|nr:helix-turn-helix transcriptional regulator [uncultured Hoeflea sp.]
MTETGPRLTEPERTCLQLAAQGQSTVFIAEKLKTCPEKIEALLASVRRKLIANTTVEAIARAIKSGLIK